MKKHPIKVEAQSGTLIISYHNKTYAIPRKIANQYAVKKSEKKNVKEKKLQTLLDDLDNKYTKAGVLLKGLRLRENMSQIEFAKKIKVTQANLSSMENGKRPIGKIIAKRIEKIFKTNYRYFLE